jgi:glycogen debranching enzyme
MKEIARRIATEELRACYQEEGIVAGTHHFSDYWGRDGFFASMGSLAIEDYKIVRSMVDLFFEHQRPDGMIPYRVMNGPADLGKYLGHSRKFKEPVPTYELRGKGPEVLDGTTLAVMTLAKLWQKGEASVDKYYDKVKKALKYLATKEKDGLLWDGEMCEWNDAAKKWGHILYSNVIYWNMFSELGMMEKKDEVAGKLRGRLWNGKFFADWHDDKRQNYFHPFGNLMAVAWGLTTNEEANSILEESTKAKVGFTLESNTPKYPNGKVMLFNRLIGIGDYQNKGMLWWQPACAYVAALVKTGKVTEARKQMELMSNKIIDDQKVFECYERGGRPVKRLTFQAEQPFAWAAGLYLWASSLIEKF